MGNVGVKFCLNLSSRSGDVFNYFFQNKMAAEPSHLWRHNKKISTVICCVDDAQEISDFSHAALYLTNFHRHTASQMTSRKIIRVSHVEFIKMYEAKFFFHCTLSEIQRSKVYRFFSSRWCPYHVTYDVIIMNWVCYQKRYILWWKFRVDRYYRSWENDF